MEKEWSISDIVKTTMAYNEIIDDENRTLVNKIMDNSTNPSPGYAMGSWEDEPLRDPLYIVIPVTVIYAIIFLTGVVGNVSTCIVISRNKSMHTATNYYLFSLAISDLLLLISGLPQEIYFIWSRYPYVFGEVFCVLRGLAAETSANATVLTITAFTVERYVAICHPFLSHTMSKLSRAIRFILVIWLVALGLAIPQALQFGIVKQQGTAICMQKIVLIEHSFEISTFLFFVTPMTLITVLYALIGLRLRSSNMMKRERPQSTQSTRTLRTGGMSRGSRRGPGQSSRRVVKMLVAVVVAFFICWAPFHAQRLVAIYGTSDNHQASSPTMHTIYAIMTYISGVLYYMSTTVNPVLYHIMSNKFREAFKETLARWCGAAERGAAGRGFRDYSVLSRSNQRHAGFGIAGQDSSDYSGNSVREESLPCGGSQLNDPSGIARGRRPDLLASFCHRYSADRAISSRECQESLMINSCKHCCHNKHCGKAYTTNVTYKNDFSSTAVQIRFSDKETNTGYQNNRETDYNTKEESSYSCEHKVQKRLPKLWYIMKCISIYGDTDNKYSFSPNEAKLTVENETQTEGETFTLMPCSIGTCSVRSSERGALEDELTSYMEEIHRRERRCDGGQFSV